MRVSIGRYTVTGTLGEGGMGIVYAARDERLGRAVAIKTIKAALAEPMARERLLREARTAARVNHPAICQLYEIGEHDGELFLAMELLEGESLAARIARGPLAVPDVVSTALGILAGVDALHRQGLIHRDLKPSNVFLTPHGVKLLDFGLAIPEAARLDETGVKLTATGTILGTPHYAAPEQLRAEAVDVRTDIFAVGAVLYEMLAGTPPFGGATPMEVFHAVIYEQAPILTGAPAVAALDRVVHRALAKRPVERYASAEAMAQDVRAALALGESGIASAQVHTLTRLIVLPLRVLRADPETDFLAFSLADAITSSLSGLQSLVVRSSLAASRMASDTPDLKVIAKDADVDVILTGTLLRAGPQLRVTTQLVEVPEATVLWSHTTQLPIGDLFSLQDELSGKIVDSLALPLTARERRMLKQDVPASPRAYEHFLRANELSRDSRQWKQALDLYRHAIDEDPHYAPAWAGLGRMHRMIGKYVEAPAEHLAQAEAALRRALELNPDSSAAENVYAHLEVDLGRAEESLVRLLRRAAARPADPQLFAGLVHASRYAGLMRASIAAAEQARRLDARVPTSVAHTFFMLQQYDHVLEYDVEGVPYVRNLALAMLGRRDEALDALRRIDGTVASRLLQYTTALRLLIEGDRAGSVAAIRQLVDVQDPEARFYVARHLAHLGEGEHALAMLDAVVDSGFFCLPALTRDPWLDAVRGTAEFAALLKRAESRHRQAVISFLSVEGDRVLGVAHPV
jgi:serine/threonine protein kinase/tetratricopeptide (TPR) repeat protein